VLSRSFWPSWPKRGLHVDCDDAPVAQWIRAMGFYPTGRGFESLPGYQVFLIQTQASSRWPGFFSVPPLCGAAVALRTAPSKPALAMFVLLGIGWSPQLALLALGAPVPLLVASGFLAGASMAFAGAMWSTLLQRLVPPEAISRVSSYDWLGSYLLMPAGFALIGPIALLIGIQGALWGSFAWAAGSSILVALLPSIQRLAFSPSPKLRTTN
jgi:hypothetical protein